MRSSASPRACSRPTASAFVVLTCLVACAAPCAGQSPAADDSTAAEVCAEGRISSIELDRREVFEPDSAGFGPLALAFRVLNAVHVRTTPNFIRGELLVEPGDCYDAFLVSESQRLLDGYFFLESARITTEPDGEGGYRLVVHTRDAWSTNVGLGVTYEDGVNIESVGVTERNFLGLGLLASYVYRDRREVRQQSVRLATPRLFGRTDAGIQVGRDRPGSFFNQYLRYPFIGETGRYSIRQGYSRGHSYFAYATPVGGGYRQVFVPRLREFVELSAAQRFGPPGTSTILGLTLSREVNRFQEPRVASVDDPEVLEPLPHAPPASLTRQLRDESSTRLWLHLGHRRFRYTEYEGLDAIRDRLLVGLGYYVGASVGKGFALASPGGVPGVDDTFASAAGEVTLPLGPSIVRASASVESRHLDAAWRDVLTTAELATYLRGRALPGQTLFLRASFADGRRTTAPFQLSLGGRTSVRSLPEDRYPGGRVALFVIENRAVVPWPQSAFDLGVTAFADLGRVWPGDAPFGVDSGWQQSVGLGVRLGVPHRTRYAWRADVAWPVGATEGDPIFRISFELNRLAQGFSNPDLQRSRRFWIGASSF